MEEKFARILLEAISVSVQMATRTRVAYAKISMNVQPDEIIVRNCAEIRTVVTSATVGPNFVKLKIHAKISTNANLRRMAAVIFAKIRKVHTTASVTADSYLRKITNLV